MTDRTMDDDLTRLLEAHVRFEVDRWRIDALPDTVAQEVAAAFDWLGTVSLQALVPPGTAQAWARRVVIEEPITDDLLEEVLWAVHAAHGSLAQETGPASDVVPPATYEQLVSAAVELRSLRREVVAQGTQSAVYAELVSHVLYHGLKNYVLTQNAVVRHLPGASSLLKMGQNAVRSVTPNLEAGIDRQLVAFVASTVAETVGESRAFLEQSLDDATLRTVAAEVWAKNGGRSVADLADLVEDDALDALVTGARDTWLAARSSPVVAHLVDAVVEQFYTAHGEQPVTELLAELGITQDRATAALTEVAGQLAPAAHDTGHLEAYVRGRLTAFYSGYVVGG